MNPFNIAQMEEAERDARRQKELREDLFSYKNSAATQFLILGAKAHRAALEFLRTPMTKDSSKTFDGVMSEFINAIKEFKPMFISLWGAEECESLLDDPNCMILELDWNNVKLKNAERFSH